MSGAPQTNKMSVNDAKSNVVHFRPNSVSRVDFNFTCGVHNITIMDRYTYLGITLNEYLDYNVTAKCVSQSASRALGLLIAKYKCIGGMSYDVFSKLYDTLVWPVISYGAAIWGSKSFSCINAVQNRAMRFFLGVGKYTPTAAVSGDMGWDPACIKQWNCIGNYWGRMSRMTVNRINKQGFIWADHMANRNCKNQTFVIKEMYRQLGLDRFIDINVPFSVHALLTKLREGLMHIHVRDWSFETHRDTGRSGNGRNKLRTYRLFKSRYEVEEYCKLFLPVRHRSAFAKFRCGVAPIKIETGRYENLDVNQRICPFCSSVEDKMHIILHCETYPDLRNNLFSNANSLLPNCNFNVLNDIEKMKLLFSHPSLIRLCAKTCFKIIQMRNSLLYH